MKAKNIVILRALDAKGEQILFLKGRVARRGIRQSLST